MKDYAANHFDRAWKVYEQVSGAKEIDFNKFTKHDAWGKATFEKVAFQKDLQKDFLTHVRYLYQTYGDLDFNMDFRAPKVVRDFSDPKKPYAWKTEWTDMKLGEALFGHELLDRHEFWKTKEGHDHVYEYDENGRHVIDYAKVQNDKITLWKNWAAMKIAADLHRHQKRSIKDRSAYDINYHHTYYLNVIEALETIPGGVLGDEYDMSKIKIPQSFFSHHDIAILKKKAGVGTGWFWTKYLWTSLSGKGEKDSGWGFSDAFSIMAKEVFSSLK